MAGYDGHRGWIYSLAVLPGKRKSRIGTRLLEHAEKELSACGCVKINLQINIDNASVKGFYLKNGYAVEERISMGKEIPENIPYIQQQKCARRNGISIKEFHNLSFVVAVPIEHTTNKYEPRYEGAHSY